MGPGGNGGGNLRVLRQLSTAYTPKTASGADCEEDAVFLDCGVTLTGLERDTEYMYKVGTGSGASSAVHYFKTGGAAEFSFLCIGDFHCYTPLPGRLNNAVKVLNAAVAVDPGVDFVLSPGDVLAWGGSYSFLENFVRAGFHPRLYVRERPGEP